MNEPAYVSVDIEASGPVPGAYSMLAIGACLVSNPTVGFYVELQPLNDAFVPEAMATCGLDLGQLKQTGLPPEQAMATFAEWLGEKAGDKPVFVGYPVAFDWLFVAWYFHTFLGRNPFGVGGVDIRSYYMGMMGVDYFAARKDRMIEGIRPTKELTHNALDDARDQGQLFRRMLERRAGEPEG